MGNWKEVIGKRQLELSNWQISVVCFKVPVLISRDVYLKFCWISFFHCFRSVQSWELAAKMLCHEEKLQRGKALYGA